MEGRGRRRCTQLSGKKNTKKHKQNTNGIILPNDVVDKIFIEYCDYEILSTTRAVQSRRVQRCTQFEEMEWAVKVGNLENMKWIEERKYTWKYNGPGYIKWAIEGGYLDCIQWLFHQLGRSENKDWLSFSFDKAVQAGNLKVVKWLHQKGCTSNDMTLLYASVYSGNLEILKWLRFNGFPWGCMSLEMARSYQANTEITNWLLENECPSSS